MKFKTGLYKNSRSKLKILVLSVLDADLKRVILKVKYVHNNGRIQYTGRGRDYMTDKIRIESKHFNLWSRT